MMSYRDRIYPKPLSFAVVKPNQKELKMVLYLSLVQVISSGERILRFATRAAYAYH